MNTDSKATVPPLVKMQTREFGETAIKGEFYVI